MTVVADGELVLRDAPGPTVLGGGWRRSFELLYLIAVNEFKRTYFGTVLGYLWSLARPLLLFAVLVTVFTKLIKLGSGIPSHLSPVFLLMNIVLFGFFGEATGNAVQSVVLQESVVRKTQFPRLVIPLAVVLTGLFNLGLNLVVVLIFLFAFGVTPVWTWILFPVVLLLLLVLTVAVSMIVSALYPRFRDVGIIWSVLSTVLFYMTPIMYPIELIQNHHLARHVIPLNPLVPIFELARKWIIQPNAPDPVAAAGGVSVLLGSIAIYVGICVFAVWIFRREAPRIAEEL
ncbi:MAG TPA: ABC transporter permease [Solirubrobacteraceae bacterium]